MSSVFPDPSFTWRSHRSEGRTWRSISLLIAITAGSGFFVGRLSSAMPGPAEQLTSSSPEQRKASGSITQRQSALQSDASTAPIKSAANKDGPIEDSTVSPMDTSKTRSTAAIEKGVSSTSDTPLNASRADKTADGDASKQHSPKAGLEAPTKVKGMETHKPASDGPPPATVAKRRAEWRSPADLSASAPTTRRDSSFVWRDDAYVPPRRSHAPYADQRGRYDYAEGDDDRPRLGHVSPDRRYAEDTPPPRTYYEYRREYLRPFQDSQDLREYRFGSYDDAPYVDRRPMLRPMYGSPDY